MDRPELISKIFLFFLLVKLIFQLYLNLRQKNHVSKHRGAVPEKFTGQIGHEDHQKAADYTIVKASFGRFNLLLESVLLYAWTLGGGLEYLDQFCRAYQLSALSTGILFFAVYGLISFLIGLPVTLYSTFVIEERFGFNKTTPKLFISDTFKQILLGIIIGLPILMAILWVMHSLGENWWIYAWALITGFQFLLLWLYPTLIAPIFNKFSPLEEGEVKERIEKLAQKIDFGLAGIYVMDASKRSGHGNAYFTGFGKNKRIVFFDTLLKTLAPDEVEAVLAHELGHFKLKHIVKMIAKSLIFTFVGFYILGQLYNSEVFFAGHGVSEVSDYMALLLFSTVSGVYTFFVTPISSWMSRKHEFEADAFAAKHSDGGKLISSLVKMYKDNASTLTPDPLYTLFYHSHPPAMIRIEHLENLN